MMKIVALAGLLALASAGPTIKSGPTRIIGGEEAVPHAYPWQISLQLKPFPAANLYNHICGGTLVDENTVVCAAHCVKGQNKDNMRVVVGAHNVHDETETTRQVSDISSMTYHEDFSMIKVVNDVSIIKLATPVTFNDYVAPLKLAEDGSDVPAGITCKNSGWGKINNHLINNLPDQLQVVDLPIMDRAECTDMYEGINQITEGMVCAGAEDIGPCNGDSGGPLFCYTDPEDETSEPYLAGIVSFGMIPCAQAGYPGVYTNVGYYRQWIEDNRN